MSDFHPIIIHLPIGLLSVYSVLECVRWKPVLQKPYWKYIKMTFLFIGLAGASMALATGEVAEELRRANHQLVEIHSLFATLSTWLYGLLAVLYLISEFPIIAKYHKTLERVHHLSSAIVSNGFMMVVLSLVSLIGITVTGALGGAIVYGPDADPIVSFVYSFFFN